MFFKEPNSEKKKYIHWLLFSVVLSVIFTLGKQIAFCGSVNGKPADNYIMPFGPKSILNFIIAFLVVNLINAGMVGINRLYTKRFQNESIKTKGDVKKTALFAILSFAFIFVMWLPYRLAYYPGGLHVDTIANIERVYMMEVFGMHALNNHHPVLYILLWRVCFVACKNMGLDLSGTIVLFTWIQFIFMAFVMTALLCWLKRHGMPRLLLAGVTCFIALFPLFPLYAISLWKDTPFSLFLLIFTMLIGDWVFDGESRIFGKICNLFLAGMLYAKQRQIRCVCCLSHFAFGKQKTSGFFKEIGNIYGIRGSHYYCNPRTGLQRHGL